MIPTHEEIRQALIERHGKILTEHMEKKTVAVCGLGGLGSNIAICLARMGIGRLILIDFDKVDITNLHRQQYKANQIGMFKTKALEENITEIAPYVELVTYSERIEEENAEKLLGNADIICEAFDGAEDKAMLVNYVLEHFNEKYLVAASGMAGDFSANLIKTRKVTKRFIMCGDEMSDVKECNGLLGSRVMLCAAHQAHAVIQILKGIEIGE